MWGVWALGLVGIATEVVKKARVNFIEIVHLVAGYGGASAPDVIVETDMTDILRITIDCTDVLLELRMLHRIGSAVGILLMVGMELDKFDLLLGWGWQVMWWQ